MDPLLDRFLRYVKLDTQADESSKTYPSTMKQLELSRMLAAECREIGLSDVSIDEFGIVMATVPATVKHKSPTIAWVAHVDTSPEFSGANVKPIVHANYDGKDIELPGDPSRVLRLSDNPSLKELTGATIVTTDGTTLLGADDKSGIAVIMTAAAHLLAHPEIAHGPIRICFTCDEEIGHGVDKVDINKLGAQCAYTLDSEGCGRIDSETFSADKATVTVTGVNTHPSVGKGVMVNAIRILSAFLAELPTETLSPETTDDRDGFLHPYHVEGSVAKAQARIILRDFVTAKLSDYAALLEKIAEPLRRKYPRAEIKIEIERQYRNMGDGLKKEPRAVAKAVEATRACGLEPRMSIIRGGTDGALLTELGLPTPNLSSGQHNPHSPLEWTSLEEMRKAVQILIELAKAWGAEKA
ncbi:MAG: peptidase T [Planctomycetaceae bacterium]